MTRTTLQLQVHDVYNCPINAQIKAADDQSAGEFCYSYDVCCLFKFIAFSELDDLFIQCNEAFPFPFYFPLTTQKIRKK